jgi:PAS domain S-box-containing protein
MFLIVAWIAVRFGVHGVVLVLLMATVQGVLGSYQGVGMFAGDSVQTQQINFWFFLLLLSTVGVALASHFAEHDQLTEELRSAKNRQGALLDAIPDLLFEIGLDGRYHQIYTYHPELLAASPEVLLGSRVQDRLPAEAAAVVLAALQQAKREGISAGHQYSLALPRGNVWFELSVSCMVTNNDATDPHFIVLSRDITARKLAEQDLRIAAIAFESQEGMLVASADHVILRVNQAFTQITGYSAHEIVGVAESFVHSEEQDADFHVKVFDTVHSTGRWQGESWIQHKNGELVAVWGTLTEVCDERQRVTHYVRTLTDITHLKQQQQHRLKQEAQLRDALVREVHHRIKNNLQGVTGVLRQYSHKHPETIEPMNQAIAQVQSIAAIHGLRGRNVSGEVLLHELLSAVAAGVQSIWHIRIDVDVKADCGECMVLQTEAVPLALVLNELLSNSVKHGGPQADVHVTLEQIATRPDEAANVRISIVNALGDEPVTTVSASDATSRSSSGLELVAALLPRQFAQLHQSALGQQFVTTLELTSPAITWKAHG